MEEKTFQKFVEMAAKWGYRVYKTSPETALIVGKFEPEEIVEPEDDFISNSSIKFEEPKDTSAYEQAFTIVYQDRAGKIKCNSCKNIFYLTKDMIDCPYCAKRIDKIISHQHEWFEEPDYTIRERVE